MMTHHGLVPADARSEVTTFREDEISILIGSDLYWEVVTEQITPLSPQVTAVETLFGWTIKGTLHDLPKGSAFKPRHSSWLSESLRQTTPLLIWTSLLCSASTSLECKMMMTVNTTPTWLWRSSNAIFRRKEGATRFLSLFGSQVSTPATTSPLLGRGH